MRIGYATQDERGPRQREFVIVVGWISLGSSFGIRSSMFHCRICQVGVEKSR